MVNITIKEWLKEKYQNQNLRSVKSISLVDFKLTQIDQEFPLGDFIRLESLEVNNIVFLSLFQEISQTELSNTIFSRNLLYLEKITIVEKLDSSNVSIESNLDFYQDIFNQYQQAENEHQEYLEIIRLSNAMTGGVFENFEITLEVKKMRTDFRSKVEQEEKVKKVIDALKYCKLISERSFLTSYNKKDDCIENLNKKLEENKESFEKREQESKGKLNKAKELNRELIRIKIEKGEELNKFKNELADAQGKINELRKTVDDLNKDKVAISKRKDNDAEHLVKYNKQLLETANRLREENKELKKREEQHNKYLLSLGDSGKGRKLRELTNLEEEKRSLKDQLNELFIKSKEERKLIENNNQIIIKEYSAILSNLSKKTHVSNQIIDEKDEKISALNFQLEFFSYIASVKEEDLITFLTDRKRIVNQLKILEDDGKELTKNAIKEYYSNLTADLLKEGLEKKKLREEKQRLEAKMEERRIIHRGGAKG